MEGGVGHNGGLTNPRPRPGRCRAGYFNTGGPPLPRKRAPSQKRTRPLTIPWPVVYWRRWKNEQSFIVQICTLDDHLIMTLITFLLCLNRRFTRAFIIHSCWLNLLWSREQKKWGFLYKSYTYLLLLGGIIDLVLCKVPCMFFHTSEIAKWASWHVCAQEHQTV